MFYVSTDVGGTFTDATVMDEAGRLVLGKAPSTPPDFYKGVIDAVANAASVLGLTADGLLKETALKLHGCTVATNALLTRTGDKAGLLTTVGFEDTILFMRSMGRHAGLSETEIKHLAKQEKPKPIIPRRLIKGVVERIDSTGKIVVPLDKGCVRRAMDELMREGIEAVAICFLWSFTNPSHEQETRKLIEEEYPKVFITASSDLIPVLGEYERTATVALNAYLGPTSSKYLAALDTLLKQKGYGHSLFIMQSHGGVLPAKEAGNSAVTMPSVWTRRWSYGREVRSGSNGLT